MFFPGNLSFRKAILFPLLLLTISSRIEGGKKNYGMPYLTIPATASSAASLSVFSQLSGDPGALFDNPTGIYSDKLRVSFSHIFWFADVQGDNIVLAFPWKNRTVGIGLSNFRIPGIEIRDFPSENPDGTVEVSFLNVSAGFSQVILERFLLGLSIKYLNEILYDNTNTGFSFDLGLKTDIPGDMILGLLLQNSTFYSNRDFNKEGLPRMVKVGVIRPELFVGSPFIISFGLNLISELNTETSGFQAGIKAIAFDKFQLRAGFEKVGQNTKKAFGFGLSFEKVDIFYSVLFLSEGLNSPNFLSINICPDLIF